MPAVAPKGLPLHILRAGRGATADSIRVDYRLDGSADLANRPRWILCKFDPGSNLVSLTTEAGPVSGASLYLLKHYYLDQPTGR